MCRPVSDAIVFFGATGDLAYKQIFPALQGLVEPVLDEATPPVTYEQGSWGPEEANELIGPDGPWHNPKPAALRP